MKVDLIAMALALCLASGSAIAQQSTTSSRGPGMSGPNLVRPCTALSSAGSTDCAIGLPGTSMGTIGGTGTRGRPTNSMMSGGGSGLGSTVLPQSAAGPLGTNSPADTLSRGISGGTVGATGAAGPLGVDSDTLLRQSMSGGSLGGRSAAGPLGGGSSERGLR